ncbi:polysaccharide biosynthesis tyrosine autokinase [Pseudonocardia lacus]|uniref:polysaccharide biosynthesis tyrosine autokinase n=1 Tax=Pseudonocardia lacus TaxID=2835865 RepID=UPI001BDD548E|nr:polysaccharide biosynthesis tyrosine autokinase [Pseudonocardia lacus]
MTIQDYIRVVRERWIILVVALALGLAGAAAAWSLRPPEYTARLSLYVSAQAADTPNAAYQGSLLSQQRVSSYVDLVSSRRVSREVIRDLGLAATPQALASRISASTAPDSVLIDVAVVGGAPDEVAAIANSVGQVLTGLVAELERPSTPGAPPPVQVRVVEPAEVPTTPSSTGLPVTLLLGLLVGLAAGVGLALLRNATDTSVKSLDQLRATTGAPNLGVIAYDPDTPKRPLTVHDDDPHSPRAEAFRQLRTNLRFVDVDNPSKVILVTSSLPAEGKTTSVCNLAIAVAAAGTRLLVVEADLRRPGVVNLLGLDGAVGLTDILAGRLRFEDVVQHWAGGGFDVLASGALPPNPSELLGSRQMADLLAALRTRYDVVLVDTPPLLPVTDAAAVAPETDGAILACRYNETTREQVGRAVEALAAVSAPVLGTLFTMVPTSGARGYAQYNTYYSSKGPVSTGGHVVRAGRHESG